MVGCRADVFPTTVSAESFEETDTARTPAFERRHGQLVDGVGVSSGLADTRS